MTDIVERVWEYSQKNPYGFTLKIDSMKPVRFGVIVAYKETQNSFGKQSLQKVIDHALRHDKIIGGWLNVEDHMFYFDSVKVFKNSELTEALKFAAENEQLAIFDLTNLREIRVKGQQ